MNKFAKVSVISLGFLSMMPPALMAERKYSLLYAQNNPIVKEWMAQQGVSLKATSKLADFVPDPNENFYSLGCHRSIFGGRNYKTLTDFDSAKTASTTAFPGKFDFEAKVNDPLIACSTASAEAQNKYEFELAIKKGDRGFIERISVDDKSVKSQITFYERNPNDTSTPYKYTLGGKRDITKDHQLSNYQTFDPNTKQKINLDKLCGTDGKCGKQPRYYSVWIDDGNGGEGLFDTIGIQNNNNKHISFVKKGGESGIFKYFSPSTNSTDDLNSSDQYYDLSVFSTLSEALDKSKGKWQKIEEFCKVYQDSQEKRIPLKEIRRLQEYCYEKKTTAKPSGK